VIPTLDLTGLSEGDEAAVDRVGTDIRAIFGTVGFAYVVGHGIEGDVVDDAFVASQAFHALPLADKMAIEVNEFHRGYLPINTSTVVTSSVDRATAPNQSASLMIMHESAGRSASGAGPLDGPNQWPPTLSDLRAPIDAFGSAMERVARSLIPAIERALDASPGELGRHFVEPTTFLRLLHYPRVEAEQASFGSTPHTDYGFITLLAQDDVGGLQVRSSTGDWLDVDPRPGTLVMNTADMLRRWSNGKLISTPHRVLAATRRDRYSLPFFFDPNTNTQVAPLTSCREATNPLFEPVIYGDYLVERLSRNHRQHVERRLGN
jgi:isopenicillin N synthase-like dioxygenase